MHHNNSDLGYDEMRRRGCPTNDYSTLDMDLKARHVSIEELILALGVKFTPFESKSLASESFLTCAPW